MSDLPSDTKRGASYPDPSTPASELTELRSLLIGPALQEDHELEAEEVSRVLPKAMKLTVQKNDPAVTEVIVPTVEQAIKTSVTTDEKILSEALFPIMGPAIRKAIAAAIQNLTDSLNQSLEHSLSPQSLSWRFEAWRTGKPFAEVLLLRTLVYQVEQVFLIHKISGLVLQHLAAETATAQDADLVSAMFTAIQDFVRDSFSVSDDTLGSLQVGELTIWVNEGPQAIIACVIRGNPPRQLRQTMENALERIHLVQKEQLHQFQGDSSAFEASQPYLEECLQAQYQAKKKRSPPLKWFGGAAGILLFGLSVWGILASLEYHKVQSFVSQLNQKPGIVVLVTQKQQGKYSISGLKDPLAADPHQLLQQTELDSGQIDFRWEPYLSFHPHFMKARVTALLQPPDTVDLTLDTDGSIQASGTASQAWITEAQQLALRLPQITAFNTQHLIPDENGLLADLKKKIETQSIFFTQNAQLVPQQTGKLQQLANNIKALTKTATVLNQDVTILVEGYTDTSGSELINFPLRETRAKALISILSEQGVDKTTLKAASGKSTQLADSHIVPQANQSHRKVTLQVLFIHPSDVDI